MKLVNILGAGLAGLTASIILRRKGYKVVVHEREKEIGSYSNFHPSLHVTPFDHEAVEELTGISFKSVIKPMKEVKYFFENRAYEANAPALYGVERSSRPTSVDTFLFKLAVAEGVEFEMEKGDVNPDELPDGSIIATGLNPLTFEKMGLPSRPVWGYAFREEVKNDPHDGKAYCWFCHYADDYGYGASINGLRYFLLFSTFRKISEAQLHSFRQDLKTRLDIEFAEPIPTAGAVPIGSFTNPRLFHRGKILAGTISGTMEPALLFGIHGAIVSGAIAAKAVEEPGKARKLFKRINRYFRRLYLSRRCAELLPLKVRHVMLETATRYPRLHYFYIALMGHGIPGYRGNWIWKVLLKEERSHA